MEELESLDDKRPYDLFGTKYQGWWLKRFMPWFKDFYLAMTEQERITWLYRIWDRKIKEMTITSMDLRTGEIYKYGKEKGRSG